jgi:hypothetical protein
LAQLPEFSRNFIGNATNVDDPEPTDAMSYCYVAMPRQQRAMHGPAEKVARDGNNAATS